MTDALTLGETMGAIRSRGFLGIGDAPAMSVAGAESNVAIGLSRLGHRSAWCSVLGEDAIGDLILRTCRAEGVDVSAVRRDPGHATGILVSQQRPMGRAVVDYHRTFSAFTTLASKDVRAALDTARPRILHVTGITPALGERAARALNGAVTHAKALGIQISFDVNHRSRLWSDVAQARSAYGELVGHADVVFGGPEELALLCDPATQPDDLPHAVLRLGPSEVVIKLGAYGARSVTTAHDVDAPAHRVDVVDPIGAGDAFVAGYLSGLLDHATPEERLKRANACGALAVSTAGDWEGLPRRSDLAALASEPGQVVR